LNFWQERAEPAAERLLDNLVEDMNSLKRMAYRNPVFNRSYLRSDKYRYMVTCERYLLIYKIVENTVFIDGIQDSRQAEDKSWLWKG